jgi:hypothetical protein
MKKIIFLFVLATALFSCSSDDDNSNINVVLQKVVFYRNSPNERHWNIENGLLKNIKLADGTLEEEFIYDSQNRVVRDIKYTNGAVTGTDVITYNPDSTIRTINGLPYTFNAATQTYDYTYGSNFTIRCQVNSDKLAVNFTRTGVNAGQYHLTYASNGSMTSFEKVTNGTTDTLKNFHFDAGFGDNPIFNAVLAVARVKSLTDPSFFIDCQASKKLTNGFDQGATSPYYFNFGQVPDIEGKLFQIGIEVLDGNNNPIDFYSFADYYYL